jgi:hypothetical protein
LPRAMFVLVPLFAALVMLFAARAGIRIRNTCTSRCTCTRRGSSRTPSRRWPRRFRFRT